MSGSGLRTRQGINVTSFTQRFVSLLPHLTFGDYSSLALSGNNDPITSGPFNDSSAGIGKQRLTRPGYHTVINHYWEPNFYGETQPYELNTNVFVDKNVITSGSSIPRLLLSQYVSSTLSEVELYQSIVSIGQMDGVIERWPFRKIIDNTAPVSYMRRPYFQVNMGGEWTQDVIMFGNLGPACPPPTQIYPIVQYITEIITT